MEYAVLIVLVLIVLVAFVGAVGAHASSMTEGLSQHLNGPHASPATVTVRAFGSFGSR